MNLQTSFMDGSLMYRGLCLRVAVGTAEIIPVARFGQVGAGAGDMMRPARRVLPEPNNIASASVSKGVVDLGYNSISSNISLECIVPLFSIYKCKLILVLISYKYTILFSTQ